MTHSWSRRGPAGETNGIPAPTGELAVGCVDLMHKFEGDTAGGLLVRLFYPVLLASGQPSFANWTSHSKYLQAYLHYQKTWGPGLKTASIENPLLNPKIPAVWGADLYGAPNTPKAGPGVGSQKSTSHTDDRHLPVIVYSHGLGGMRCDHSAICCDFASHGYLMAAVEHRDQSACTSLQRVPDLTSGTPQFKDQWREFKYHSLSTPAKAFAFRNRQVLQRSRDAILALELLTMLNEGVKVDNMMEGDFDFRQFQGRLDMRTAAIMGHSFGGATTIQALSQDHRFLCGIALDCWMVPIHRDLLETGVQQPLLFINSDFQWAENVRAMLKLTQSCKKHSQNSTKSIITLSGSGHLNQSDIAFLPLFSEIQTWFMSLLEPTTAFRINSEICHAFFGRYLLRDPAYQDHVPNLDGGEGQSEHIIFGSNLPIPEEVSKL